ncbi:MAG: hypothetical protein MI867_17685, partial [Pseudomonadales bacterium]|nr:hypothetical protein [Pseudomonadales bacterium]
GFDFRNAVVSSRNSMPTGSMDPVDVVSDVQDRAEQTEEELGFEETDTSEEGDDVGAGVTEDQDSTEPVFADQETESELDDMEITGEVDGEQFDQDMSDDNMVVDEDSPMDGEIADLEIKEDSGGPLLAEGRDIGGMEGSVDEDQGLAMLDSEQPMVEMDDAMGDALIQEFDDQVAMDMMENAPMEMGQDMHGADMSLAMEETEEMMDDQDGSAEDETLNESGEVDAVMSQIEDVMIDVVEDGDGFIDVSDADVSLFSLDEATDRLEDDDSVTLDDMRDVLQDVVADADITVDGDNVGGAAGGGNNGGAAGGDNTGNGGGTGSGDTIDTDARLSDTERSLLGETWGIATVAMEPDSSDPEGPTGVHVGGQAPDASISGIVPFFVDRGEPPSYIGYSDLAITNVLKIGTHSDDATNVARYDSSIDTTTEHLAWGHWSGGNARLFTDADDGITFTPVSDSVFWLTGLAADPTSYLSSGEVRFDNTFLLAGVGSNGPILDDDLASVSIGFTLSWVDLRFSDGEFKIKNGISGDTAQQSFWKFHSLSGSLVSEQGQSSAVLEFSEPPVGEYCTGDCSSSISAEGEILAFLMRGNSTISGTFSFWQQGNTSEWVTGVFAVGEETRYSISESQNLSSNFYGVFSRHPSNAGGLTTSPILSGVSEQPTSGNFLMVDELESNYGAVIRLDGNVIGSTGATNINGFDVEWGSWDSSSVATRFDQAAAVDSNTYTWITFESVPANVMDNTSGTYSFSVPNAFYGWQNDSGGGGEIPLSFGYGYVNVFLDGDPTTDDSFSGEMVLFGDARFDLQFSGTAKGDGITLQSSSAFYNGSSVLLDFKGEYVGSTLAEGFAGAFKINDAIDSNLFASGVFGFGREDRLSDTEIATMNLAGFMSIGETNTGNTVTFGGIASQPSSGIFVFRDQDPNNSIAIKPSDPSPEFYSVMVGTTNVDWGYWDDLSGSVTVQDNPIDTSSSASLTDPVSWVVANVSDPADIPTTGVTLYNKFAAANALVGSSNGMPFNTPIDGDITVQIDFASQSFTSQLNVSASVDTWSMNYNGAVSGATFSGSGTGFYNSVQAASGSINGAMVGTGSGGSGPEGVIGAFKNHVDADHSIHSSGVFVLEQ